MSEHKNIFRVQSVNKAFIIAVVINLIFISVETTVGLMEHSLSLLSDAGHNLRDVFSLLLVLIAFRLAKIKRNKHFTYGYKKSTILISLVNSTILIAALCAIIIESILKFHVPANVNGEAMSWTATAGIIVNGITAALLINGQKHDINIRGAFLHKLIDAMVSVGVVISGIIITYTGWNIIDPIVSLAIAIVILIPSIRLLIESLRLSLDGIPHGIKIENIEALIKNNIHVIDVHHIHIWALSTTENALTAHISIDDISNMEDVKREIKKQLEVAGINHPTIEFESSVFKCDDIRCKMTSGVN